VKMCLDKEGDWVDVTTYGDLYEAVLVCLACGGFRYIARGLWT
jgi:hypothetical protein